ncbi:MAG: GAF domain-containing protein [Clostridia bacterium]|nr:GAF domain-containing protein [Clostridia bacterium]
MKTDYEALAANAAALTDGVRHLIANLANISALIYETLEDINWAGFYLLEDDTLVLGPFQGKPACVEIAWGRGVCGTAACRDKPVVVKDVHEFAGHIACDSASRSEIVIPLHKHGRVWGVLDIDSPLVGRFDTEDCEGLMLTAQAVERIL